MAIGKQGEIYGVAAASNLVLKFSPQGTLIATWHRAQGAGIDQWNNPETISIDRKGNLVIADWGNARILTLSPNGQTVGAFPAVPNEPLNLSSVSGAVVGPGGDIYVADYQLFRVQVFNSNGQLLATLGNTPGNRLFEKAPNSIAIDREGHLYASDGLSVVKFSREGTLLARWR